MAFFSWADVCVFVYRRVYGRWVWTYVRQCGAGMLADKNRIRSRPDVVIGLYCFLKRGMDRQGSFCNDWNFDGEVATSGHAGTGKKKKRTRRHRSKLPGKPANNPKEFTRYEPADVATRKKDIFCAWVGSKFVAASTRRVDAQPGRLASVGCVITFVAVSPRHNNSILGSRRKPQTRAKSQNDESCPQPQ